ncbi:hypothetical protein diail_855 [Diaporthe ilicicola]|nr:hypothetical protein diail_855 [Diaporthe ilicicola]
MASSIEPPWRSVRGSPSPKNVHCLSGELGNVDNKRQNVGNPLSPERSPSPRVPSAISVDSESSDESIPNTPPRPTLSNTTGPHAPLGLNTLRGRPGNFEKPVPSAVSPTIRNVQGQNTQTKQYQGVEPKAQRNYWRGIHDSPRGVPVLPPFPHLAEKSREHDVMGNGRARTRLPSIDIPSNGTNLGIQGRSHISHQESNNSFGTLSSSVNDGLRRSSTGSRASSGSRTSSTSEGMRWSSSPPTSMPPPPLPLQASVAHAEPLPRILERAPAFPRTTPLSVSELIHREANGAEPTSSSASNASTHTMGQEHSLAHEFMDTMMLRDRIADYQVPRFLETLNHQLSYTGLLREAREIIYTTFDLTEPERNIFAVQTMGMLSMGEPAREMRAVIARAVVGMSRREMSDFECEVDHMLNNSMSEKNNPDREALICASRAGKFPEDQQAELIRQLKNIPPAALQTGHPHTAVTGKQIRGPTELPPIRDRESRFPDTPGRRAGVAGANARKDPIRPPPTISLREFPIFSSH